MNLEALDAIVLISIGLRVALHLEEGRERFYVAVEVADFCVVINSIAIASNEELFTFGSLYYVVVLQVGRALRLICGIGFVSEIKSLSMFVRINFFIGVSNTLQSWA